MYEPQPTPAVIQSLLGITIKQVRMSMTHQQQQQPGVLTTLPACFGWFSLQPGDNTSTHQCSTADDALTGAALGNAGSLCIPASL